MSHVWKPKNHSHINHAKKAKVTRTRAKKAKFARSHAEPTNTKWVPKLKRSPEVGKASFRPVQDNFFRLDQPSKELQKPQSAKTSDPPVEDNLLCAVKKSKKSRFQSHSAEDSQSCSGSDDQGTKVVNWVLLNEESLSSSLSDDDPHDGADVESVPKPIGLAEKTKTKRKNQYLSAQQYDLRLPDETAKAYNASACDFVQKFDENWNKETVLMYLNSELENSLSQERALTLLESLLTKSRHTEDVIQYFSRSPEQVLNLQASKYWLLKRKANVVARLLNIETTHEEAQAQTHENQQQQLQQQQQRQQQQQQQQEPAQTVSDIVPNSGVLMKGNSDLAGEIGEAVGVFGLNADQQIGQNAKETEKRASPMMNPTSKTMRTPQNQNIVQIKQTANPVASILSRKKSRFGSALFGVHETSENNSNSNLSGVGSNTYLLCFCLGAIGVAYACVRFTKPLFKKHNPSSQP